MRKEQDLFLSLFFLSSLLFLSSRQGPFPIQKPLNQKTECACAFSGAIKLRGSVTRLGVETLSGPENDEATN